MPDRIILAATRPLAIDVTDAIQRGDGVRLRQLLDQHPHVASCGIAVTSVDGETAVRSLLHIATDWPGHFPNIAQTIAVLVAAGADVNARFVGKHAETPLHWAASSDDLDALDALLAAGADIEASGGIVGGGTALADLVRMSRRAARGRRDPVAVWRRRELEGL